MSKYLLEFEKPIKQIEDEILLLKNSSNFTGIDLDERIKGLKDKFGESSDGYWYKSMELMKDDMTEVAPTVDVLIDHIDYIAQLIGVDHVGLGSDFDGIPVLPNGIDDCTKLPVITEKLLERGYSKKEVRKILGENFRRVFKEVVLN